MSPSGALISEITADAMLPYTGQTFVFEGAGAPASMQLTDVTRFPRHAGTPREPFSLLFVMRGQTPLVGGILRMIHRDFEPLDIFLERVTVPDRERADPAAMFYEAVFN